MRPVATERCVSSADGDGAAVTLPRVAARCRARSGRTLVTSSLAAVDARRSSTTLSVRRSRRGRLAVRPSGRPTTPRRSLERSLSDATGLMRVVRRCASACLSLVGHQSAAAPAVAAASRARRVGHRTAETSIPSRSAGSPECLASGERLDRATPPRSIRGCGPDSTTRSLTAGRRLHRSCGRSSIGCASPSASSGTLGSASRAHRISAAVRRSPLR